MKFKSFLVLLFVVLSLNIKAQYFLGVGGSSYGGTHLVHYNPALVADSRQIADVNIFSLGVFASNNHLSLNAKNGQISENLREEPRYAYFNLDVRGPAALYSFTAKTPTKQFSLLTVGFDTRFRTGFSITGMNVNTARLLWNGIAEETLQNINYLDADFNLGAMAWRETGFTVATTILNTKQHVVNFGAHIKFLTGYDALYITSENARYRALNDDSLFVFDLEFDYGYADDNFQSFDNGDESIVNSGKGTAFDIGIVYENRKDIYRMGYRKRMDETQNKYQYRAGISLLDAGKINYKSPRTKTFTYSGQSIVTRKEIDSLDGPDDWDALAKSKFAPDSRGSEFSMSLPTHLNIHFDYKITGPFYLNCNYLASVGGAKAIAVKQGSFFTATPRYETRKFEAAIPFSIINQDRANIGFLIRWRFFTLGSDDFTDVVFNDIDTFNFYFGFRIPIYRN